MPADTAPNTTYRCADCGLECDRVALIACPECGSDHIAPVATVAWTPPVAADQTDLLASLGL